MSYLMKYLLVLVIFTGDIYCGSHLMKCLQPDDIDCGKYDNPKDVPDHICARECIPGVYKTCYYRFVVEAYSTMNGACGRCPNVTSDCHGHHCVTCDGFEKSILCINRRMPAPLMQVCKGDYVIVDLKNSMLGRSTTIHWHGLRQVNAKHMDGVPMVTQCPILESEIFRYHFKADYPGTHFYHSHSGLQKVDGVVGGFHINTPKSEDPNCNEYDCDCPSHTVLVQDWFHDCADCRFPGLQKRGPTRRQEPDTYLINGKGQFINGTNGTDVPLAMFNVTEGKRCAFKFIAGTCFACQYVCSIKKHYMTIIGAEGQPTKPYKVKSLTMSPGERYKVVVHFNQPVGSYWMHCGAVGFCRETRAYQLAIVRYHGHSGIPSTPKPGYDDVTGDEDILPLDIHKENNSTCSSLQPGYNITNDIDLSTVRELELDKETGCRVLCLVPDTPQGKGTQWNYLNLRPDCNVTRTVSHVESNCTKENEVELGPCIADLKHAFETPKHMYEEPCKTLILALGFHSFPNNTPYTNTSKNKYPKFIAPGPGGLVAGTINGCTYESAPCPLLSQWSEVPKHMFCDDTNYGIEDWNNDVHECINVLRVPSHCVVKMYIMDASPIGLMHPFHLHGYDMCIVAQGKLSELGNFTSFKDKFAAMKKHMSSAERKPVPCHCPNKDTVPLLPDGYIEALIYTDNKGPWFFHCHFAYHLEPGMAGVVLVGSPNDFPPVPKGFPKCGDFLPKMTDCGCHSCY